MLKVGDKVRFLNEVGGGVITQIVNQSTVILTDEDGFEVPTLISDIIVVNDVKANNFPTQTNVNAMSMASTNKPDKIQHTIVIAPQAKKDEKGSSCELMIAFLSPDKDKTKLYLLNDSTYQMAYNISTYEHNGNVQSWGQGIATSDSKTFIKSLVISEFREPFKLRIEVILFKNTPYLPHNLAPVDIEINPLKFFKQGVFKATDFFDKDALIYHIYSNELIEKKALREISTQEIRKAILSKNEKEKPIAKKNNRQSDIEEVDLHAEALINNSVNMQAGDLLALQLSRFSATLENAVKSGKKGRIVFIHGVGSGRLKLYLRQQLCQNYPQLHYQDASFREYGYGATIVFL
ncbi:MAG: DUF2027 domain-containing protein [Bacteroidales bacterium]